MPLNPVFYGHQPGMTGLRLIRESARAPFSAFFVNDAMAWEVMPQSLPLARERAGAMFDRITESIQDLVASGWSAEEVFWSRYFWFSAVVASSHALDGYDAGLQQQAFQILEAPFPDCEPDLARLPIVDLAAKEALSVFGNV